MTSDFQIKEEKAFDTAVVKYAELVGIASSGTEATISQTAKSLYDTFDRAKCSIKKGRKSVEITGVVYAINGVEQNGEPYTSSNWISEENSKKGLMQLAEDLTMAAYKLSGGTKYTYTPFLISSIENQLNKTTGLCR